MPRNKLPMPTQDRIWSNDSGATGSGKFFLQNSHACWDVNTEPDLAGYKVHWGKSSGHDDNTPVPTVTPSANPTFATLALPNGTWYFAVIAYNTARLESGYSNEVSKTIAVAPESPNSLRIWILQTMAWRAHRLIFWA